MRLQLSSSSLAIVALVSGLSQVACGSSQISVRMVDTPVGEAITYGAPTKTTYLTELDAGREYGTLTVYQRSVCDVIPVQVMQRYKETLEGDKVIERSPQDKRQVPGQALETVACDQTYARNVEVLLEADGGRFSLGMTDAWGRVGANLAAVFKVGSFDEVPAEATIVLRSIKGQPSLEVGTVSLAQLKKHQARVTDLLAQLAEISQKEPGSVEGAERSRAYEIYAQLVDLAPYDPRVVAAGLRFWQFFEGQRREDSREALGKTLDALSEAQSTLKVMGDAAVPLYVQAAVSSGTLDARTLEWASLRLLRAMRGTPEACGAGFSFASVPTYGWARDAQLAAQYVHYSYGPGHAAVLQRSCLPL